MGVVNMSATRRRLERLAKLPENRIQALMRLLVLEGMAGVIDATPRDTGRLVAGWDAAIGSKPTRVEPPRQDGAAADTRSGSEIAAEKAGSVLAELPAFTIVYITNNTPYAEVIELGLFEPENPGPSDDPRLGRKDQELVVDGYSTQAPAGMLRNGLTRIAYAVRRASGGLS